MTRTPFRDLEERQMWLYLHRKLMNGDPFAKQPFGLRFWRQFVEENCSSRSFGSLASRFRKYTFPRLHEAPLKCSELLFVCSELTVPLTDTQRRKIEERFKIRLECDINGVVNNYEEFLAEHRSDHDSQSTILSTSNIEELRSACNSSSFISDGAALPLNISDSFNGSLEMPMYTPGEVHQVFQTRSRGISPKNLPAESSSHIGYHTTSKAINTEVTTSRFVGHHGKNRRRGKGKKKVSVPMTKMSGCETKKGHHPGRRRGRKRRNQT